MQTRPSKILDGYHLAIFYPEDKEYADLQPLFKTYGLAITDTRSNVVCVDGGAFDDNELDNSHIDAIDAHEMSHIILGHGVNDPNAFEEMSADYLAILILNALNYTESAEILIDNFKDRHGFLYEEAEERVDDETFEKIRQFMGKHFPGKDVINEIDAITREFFDQLVESKLTESKQRLVENRVDDAKSWGKKSGIPDDVVQDAINESEKIQSNHKYLNWILKMIHQYGLVDHAKIYVDIIEPLKYFNSHIAEFATRDINAFENLEEFVKVVKDVKSKERRSYKEQNPGELVFENDTIQIFTPTTMKSSCYYGSGSKWCTTMKDQNYYNDYKRVGELYYIISKVKSTDEPTYKMAIRFKYKKNETGYEIAEIRDAVNNRMVPLEEFDDGVGSEGYKAIVDDLNKRHKDDIDKHSLTKLKADYANDPKSVLSNLDYNELTSFFRWLDSKVTIPNGVFDLLLKYDINPLRKDIPEKEYLAYLEKDLPYKDALVQFISELMEVRGWNIYESLSLSFIRSKDITIYIKTAHPDNWPESLVVTILTLYDYQLDSSEKYLLNTYAEFDDVFGPIWERFNGLDGLFDYIHLYHLSYFNFLTKNLDSLNNLLKSAIKHGSTIMDVYNIIQKYRDETNLNPFEVVIPKDWAEGFKKMYGDEEGIGKLIPFLMKNSIIVFDYLPIENLNQYYGNVNETINAAINYYSDNGEFDLLGFLESDTTLEQQLDYFEDRKKSEDDDKLLDLLELYRMDIFDYYSVDDIEKATGYDIEFMSKIFAAADLTNEFEEHAGQLRMFLSYAEKSGDKELTLDEKLNYKKQAFKIANMHDTRLNPDGTVDLICGGWGDFESWFYDGDIGRGGGNPRYVAKKLLADEDFWEPFYDVVQDWYNDVWEVTTDENIQKVREHIIEKLVPEEIPIDPNDFDLDSDDFPVNEDGNFILSPETLDKISNDSLGEIINEHDDFEDIKNNMRWAFADAYNQTAVGEWYESYTNAILKTIDGGDVRWEKTGKTKITRYKSGDEDKSYTTEIENFVIPNISFFTITSDWAERNKEYENEFQYDFMGTVQNNLSEGDGLLIPDPSEYPDHRMVEKNYNDNVPNRLYD